jgi:hypothetical protein
VRDTLRARPWHAFGSDTVRHDLLHGTGARAVSKSRCWPPGYVCRRRAPNPRKSTETTVTARTEIGDSFSRYQFVKWQVIPRFTGGSPMPMVNGNSITVHPRNTLKAYAIYDVAEVNIPEGEIVPQSYALYDRASRPFLIVGPLGDPQPIPTEDLKRLVAMLQLAENDLRARGKF